MMPVPHTCGFKTKLANLRSHLFVKWTCSFWRFTVYSSMRKSVRTVIYTLVIIKQQKLEFLVNASGNCCLIWSVYFKAIITFVHIGLLLITLAVIIGIQKTRLVGWWQAFFVDKFGWFTAFYWLFKLSALFDMNKWTCFKGIYCMWGLF